MIGCGVSSKDSRSSGNSSERSEPGKIFLKPENMLHALSSSIPQSIKNIFYHFPIAVFSAAFFGFPAKRLKVIGITGTNGKTTTTRLVAKILERSGKRVAMASTINFQIRERQWSNASKFTTLSSWRLQKFLHEAVDAECEYAVLEVSSHALDQYRMWGIPCMIAVMTNVTREHLDYHKTMEYYRQAKRRLFDRARMAVVNLDMERPEEYLQANIFEKQCSYSAVSEEADITAHILEEKLDGSVFALGEATYAIHLPGRYNIENALAAIAVGMLLEIDPEIMRQTLAEISVVPGRMELVPNNRNLRIIIDYAVTPDSLEKLYGMIAATKPQGSRIIAVFGACGERDRGKRPMMGRIVSSQADIVILTNEDPYHEDPGRIIDEIEQGISGKEKGKNWFRILDRREAIAKALSLAEPGDIVVVTGKGAEETMRIGDRNILWNERAVIEELLG